MLDHGSVYNHPVQHRMERRLGTESWGILLISFCMSPNHKNKQTKKNNRKDNCQVFLRFQGNKKATERNGEWV